MERSVRTPSSTADVDYEVIRQSLPAGVVPAYDGLRLETH
jgi:phosphoribosyl 1,2-cyclic phosphate phosphodiesterase